MNQFAGAAVTSTTDWVVKQWKCVPSQVWSWELQARGTSGLGLLWGLAVCLAGEHLPPVAPHDLPSVGLCPNLFPRAHTYWISAHPHGLLLNFLLNHLFKESVSKYSPILRYWGLGLQHIHFGVHDSRHNSEKERRKREGGREGGEGEGKKGRKEREKNKRRQFVHVLSPSRWTLCDPVMQAYR